MPLQETSGNVTTDAYGGGVAAVPNYIEDVFSTYLYTGNGATGQAINNGINLSTKGGLVWLKSRTTPSGNSDNNLYDTARGASQLLVSNSTAAQTTATRLSFQTTGFNLTNEASSTNESGVSYASWTFRKQPKFFDIVTYTGNGSTQAISHNLGSVPGCIIVKRLNNDSNTGWPVYHRSLGSAPAMSHLFLNLDSVATGAQEETWFGNNTNSVNPTSTQFTVGNNQDINANTNTYVAYLFAHNAGGFGLTGTDNVISCGSYTGNGSTNGPTVTLGYEPQWLLVKNTTEAGDWYLVDVMRGWTASTSGNNITSLNPNTTNVENTDGAFAVTSTGFKMTVSTAAYNNSGSTYIYIAIRRGPMKVPTSGTSVFKPTTAATDASAITTNFPVDLFTDWLTDSTYAKPWVDRLRGPTQWLTTTSTAIEASSFNANLASNVSYTPNFFGGSNIISYAFKRAPSFFDEVCFTGTGSNTTVSHNLAVVPEFIVVKKRNAAGTNWFVYSPTLGNTNYILLNSNNGSASGTNVWNSTTPTSSVFSVGTNDGVNGSSNTYVAYLFATCAGVSKVGSYTGNGTTQTINCGFGAGGARFVLIKRTDSTGDWYAYDTARGMTTLTDPYTLVNTTSAQVSTLGSVTTVSTGFAVNASILAAINTNAATYIFLAIA